MKQIKEFIKSEYKFIIVLVLIYLTLQIPVDYYIVVGGGASDVSSRIKVSDGYKSRGSLNISYVEELRGNVSNFLLSYIIPTWERDSIKDYKYNKNESIKDVDFRGDISLKDANSTATYWAYTLAGKKVEEISSKLYVLTKTENYATELHVGDEILSIDDNSYKTVDEYKEYFQTKNKNDKVKILIIRDSKEKTVYCKLHEYKGKKILGVVLQQLKRYKVDPYVSISFKTSESGPSGGLITTLEIYNQLTKKDITKGYKITGTGTIEYDGTIGEIGGIEHKLLGAEDAKTDYFLAPSGKNYKDAIKYKKKKKLKLKIIEVKTIEDAIKKLEKIEKR